MAHLTVQRLLEEAQSGERKLNTEERRRVVGWLKSTDPDVENADMARWFKVSEGAIRKDIKLIREQMANDVKEDDIALVIADILWDFRRQIRDIEKSKAKAKLGSPAYLAHCKEAMELRLKTVKALQDLGYLPKNLGNMTVDKFEYAAVVLADQTVDTRPIDLFDDDTKARIYLRAKNKQDAQVVEAEYEELPPQLPPARTVEYENSTSGELPQNIEGAVAGAENQAGENPPAAAAPETSGTD